MQRFYFCCLIIEAGIVGNDRDEILINYAKVKERKKKPPKEGRILKEKINIIDNKIELKIIEDIKFVLQLQMTHVKIIQAYISAQM